MHAKNDMAGTKAHFLPKASYFASPKHILHCMHAKRDFVSGDQMKSFPTKGIFFTAKSKILSKTILLVSINQNVLEIIDI